MGGYNTYLRPPGGCRACNFSGLSTSANVVRKVAFGAAALAAPDLRRSPRRACRLRLLRHDETSLDVNLFGFTIKPHAKITRSPCLRLHRASGRFRTGRPALRTVQRGRFTMHVDDGTMKLDVAANEYRVRFTMTSPLPRHPRVTGCSSRTPITT